MDEWNDQLSVRPKKADFATSDDDLDGMRAWRNFGGLSRKEAYENFCDRPDYYQEDFMFMGGVAFAYYFVVIERYIMESSVKSEDEGEEVEAMWILAHCIKIQFRARDSEQVEPLQQRSLELVKHVRSNLKRYCVDHGEQKKLDEAWGELEVVLHSERDSR